MVNTRVRQNAYYRNFKWTFEDLLPCYCYCNKSNSRTIRSYVPQPASAGKAADMSEQQAHHCIRPGHWTVNLLFLLCSGAARNFVREGPVTKVVRVQSLVILHKDYFDVTAQFLVYYNSTWRQISSPVGINKFWQTNICSMRVGRIFSRGANGVFSQHFYQGDQKWWNLFFTPRNWTNNLFLPIILKSRRAKAPPATPSDAHDLL